MTETDRAGQAFAILHAAETIKETGGTVEISGVKIEACDEYGRTASERLQVIPDHCYPPDSVPLPDATGDGYDWPQPRDTITAEAEAAVYGDRGDDYGHPRDHWTRTAVLVTGLLQHKLADGEYITPEDWGRIMVAEKLARDVHSPKRDNRTDIAGYALCLDRLETGK